MKIEFLAAAAVMTLMGAGQAAGATMVFGGGLAEECSRAALAERSDVASILDCDHALELEDLSTTDRAGTFINRGVMKLRRGQYEAAHADFDAGIALAPKMGEGWINRGAMFIGQKQYRAGLDDLNKGLALGVKEGEKAYFNRALAYEGLDDEKAAYLDYQQALALKPDWPLPQRELLRFTVTRR